MRRYYYFIIASLLVSLFIYLFYRTEKTVVNEIAIRIISFNSYVTVKKAIIRFLPLNEVVIYSLPEGLWVFCITLTSKPYYIQYKFRQINCVVIPLLFSVGLEMCQLLHFTNGRFDPIDIVVSLFFWLMATLSFNEKSSDKQNILTPLNRGRMVCFLNYGVVYLSHVLE
ncbi:hypothetical protein GCM10023189_04650 [Nibrella saemangeumensis]|uniref:VanZ-like domain-containing protein n=1 Tax=Nibrella saemangeumensis TaxID=1084526 RepID=A0ABP8MCT7_9BACT